jgi:hypothetical protein
MNVGRCMNLGADRTELETTAPSRLEERTDPPSFSDIRTAVRYTWIEARP